MGHDTEKKPDKPDYACPKCGWRVSYLEWCMAQFNFHCMWCGESRLSEFEEVEK